MLNKTRPNRDWCAKVTPGPKGNNLEIVVSITKQDEVFKWFTEKSLVPDYYPLALASIIN